jgi:tetratricopeptide (TPR) repeat protein/predicted Ser/Thr protein kinase
MDGLSPIDALLTGRLRDDEFLSAVDRVIADGSDADRTMLLDDWRTKSGRIRRPETRRLLDEKVRRLPWSSAGSLIGDGKESALGAGASVRVGDILADRFVIEAELGTGGMGTVFRALDLRRQEALDRHPHVAMKTLSADVLSRDDSLQILQREARKAQSLSHPNIVRIYDFDRDGATLFMTMELLVGVSLETTIRKNGPAGAPFSEMLPVIEQMVAALQFAHDEGIVHSDLKPSNVIILPNGRVKVIDFGIARAIPNPNEQTADHTRFDINALGAMTPAYASPEMIEGSDPDPRDDVFALACIVFECLTGRHPFGRTPASLARAGNITLTRPAAIQPLQWMALQRGLHFDRAQRTPSPSQFLSELIATGRKSVFASKGMLFAGALGIGVVCIAAVAMHYSQNITGLIGNRAEPGTEAAPPTRPSAGVPTVTTPDDAAARAQAATRQARQKAAEEAAAQQAQQKAAEEAAAQQAQQKAAEEAAAQQAQQKASQEATTRPIPPRVADIGPPQIAEAQRVLTSMGLDTGDSDGKIGSRTREMVQAFQSAIGVPPTGEITAALLALLRGSPPSATARSNSLSALAAGAARHERIADAIRLYEDALKLSPKDTDALLAIGDLHRDQANYDAAQHAYEEAQRGGGPNADIARRRLAALPALQRGPVAQPGPGMPHPQQSNVTPERPFDGTYKGTAQLVGFSNPNCGASFRTSMTVSDSKVSFRYRSDTSALTIPVAADGTFRDAGTVIRAAPYLMQSLVGRVDGDRIEADSANRSCKYHLSLQKSG